MVALTSGNAVSSPLPEAHAFAKEHGQSEGRGHDASMPKLKANDCAGLAFSFCTYNVLRLRFPEPLAAQIDGIAHEAQEPL